MLGARDGHMFLSNYDHSFSRYLDDFGGIAFGLARLWGMGAHSPGLANLERFKDFARTWMTPHLVWYSAYPDTAVTQVWNNEALRRGVLADPSTVDDEESAAAPGQRKGSMMSRPDTCDWADVQGLVRSGYKHLPYATYVLFRIADAGWARGFLASLLPHVTGAHEKPGDRALNVALSCRGLRVLGGLKEVQMSTFPYPFSEGIAGTRHRSRGASSATSVTAIRTKWFWGGRHRPVDGLLVLYHEQAHDLATWVNQLRGAQTSGLKWMTEVVTSRDAGREAFGFRDGLSQPLLADSHVGREHPNSRHLVKLGEVLLGYEDNAGEESRVPALPGDPDFGVNGTYLVARQIAQHVDQFWAYVEEAGRPLGLSREEFAARIVGRTLDGEVLMPGGTTRSLALGNEFGFSADTDGRGCPLGAHIRRGNPRDMLGNDPDASWDIVNRHRVLRRGRAFGRRGWTSYYDPQPPPNRFNEPGLMFVVLNADIERQFEFVQQNWINDPGFAELGHERDPLDWCSFRGREHQRVHDQRHAGA